MKLQQSLSAAKHYILEHSEQLKIAAIAFGGVLVVVLLVGLYVYNTESKQIKLDYNPVSACALLTNAEAKELLGNAVIDNNSNKATVTGNRAVSKCAYTGSNPATVAKNVAVAVKSAINDKGIQENKDDFALQKEANKVEVVTGVGDEAFFIPAIGQLNILSDKSWILITFGEGDDPSSNTLDDALKVSEKVLKSKQS